MRKTAKVLSLAKEGHYLKNKLILKAAKEGHYLKNKLILKSWGLFYSSWTLKPIFDTDFSQLSGDELPVLETVRAMQATRKQISKQMCLNATWRTYASKFGGLNRLFAGSRPKRITRSVI